ncbi:CRISPR-associated endoribonuclease Cas6 [Aneurinibacillus sp. UBA3580]|jgi:CRISPR-associated endoribonuclease Cas6|uniref:CRISPR-associated endoribonuclease Cas6 n=1 Tax=Aneurinibacillus sp. UBA3580 TaxID=1946041 RepID=UPI00257E239B|nr:CRISPR-associated endoribonuclease Cas6 [Aneurinibacillus sp. UBA3580]
MRFSISLSGNGSYIKLPIHYNALIQAALYNQLSPEVADFLHNKGFIVDNRRFPLFAFSRIIGDYRLLRKENKIVFSNPVQLIVSSPVPEFVRDIAQILLKDGFRVGNQMLTVTSLKMDAPTVDNDEIIVQTLSPIVAYSTMKRSDGRKYTVYFEPKEDDFQSIVINNLLRKGRLLYGENTPFQPITIRPVCKYKQHVVMYKQTIIKGYSGKFLLKGDQRLLQVAIDAALGSKNAMGFGLVEMKQ